MKTRINKIYITLYMYICSYITRIHLYRYKSIQNMYSLYLQNANTSARIDININNHLHDMYDKYIHIYVQCVP